MSGTQLVYLSVSPRTLVAADEPIKKYLLCLFMLTCSTLPKLKISGGFGKL